MSKQAIILTAPQGWGKTRQASALMQQHGCAEVVDDWHPNQPLRAGALHLTNLPPADLEPLRSNVVAHGWK